MSTDLAKDIPVENMCVHNTDQSHPTPLVSASNSLWAWPESRLGRISLMGVLNVTPDSFYDGGVYHHSSPQKLVNMATQRGVKLINDGALYLDIGGESSRPGAESVDLQTELDRVLPVIEQLLISIPKAIISVDTVKPQVAEASLKAGAKIINDIQGLRNPDMRSVIAKYRASVVLMHMRGIPKTMQQDDLKSADLTTETYEWLAKQRQQAISEGINSDSIALDVGIGFGKTVTQNLDLLKHLNRFQQLGSPLLVGASRKSFIGAISGGVATERLPGSLAAIIESARRGGNIFRVHDVSESRQALMIAESIHRGKQTQPPLDLTEYLRLLGR